MDGVELFILDLSSNLFKDFPYKALKLQKKLKILNMSRNKMESIPQIISAGGSISNNFGVFDSLKTIDFSSNEFTEFPLCVKDAPNLEILRLIHNKIKSIPTEYFKTTRV